jgi:hypothetical protein
LVEEQVQSDVLRKLQGRPMHRCAGGSAANTIAGIADFGGKAAYAGKVGQDEFGDALRDDMQRMGIRFQVPPHGRPTGTCVVLITDDAQRTMLTHLGVSAELGPDDIDEDELRHAKFVYVEGYLFTSSGPKAAALRAIDLAKQHGVKVALTVSDPFLIDLCRDEFWALIKGPVDLLFCNEQEARSLTGRDDPIESASEIHRHADHVALTLGKHGSILMNDGQTIPIEGVDVEAVDTTGAGDMYAAGVLYGITHGLTWKQAGHLASHAAARVVSQLGARLRNPFTPQEIAELLG